MRINAIAIIRNLTMAAAVVVAGCDKERCEPAPQATKLPDQSADIRKAVEYSVRVSAKTRILSSSVAYRYGHKLQKSQSPV